MGQIFMTFSEYLNFKKSQLKQLPDGRYYKPGRSCGILNSIKLLQKMPEKVDDIEGCTIIDLGLALSPGKIPPKECPASDEFKLIQGKCYAFENVLRTFDDTQVRCSQIFGSNIGGKIFEPRTDEVLEDVLKQAAIIWSGANPQLWLGITDRKTEGDFAYSSDDQSNQLSWGYVRTNAIGIDCLLLHHSSSIMNHWDCSKTLAAICEWVI
jgi:hypothetical protein